MVERLYARRSRDLLDFFARNALDKEAAYDLVHATFAEMARALAEGTIDRASDADTVVDDLARSQLARFLITDVEELRKGMKGGDRGAFDVEFAWTIDPNLVLDDDPYERVAKSARLEQVEDAFAALSERERLVITLYNHEGMTRTRIAEVLGVRPERVEHLRGEALRALAARVSLLRENAAPQPAILGPDGEPLAGDSAERREIEVRLAEISEELIERLGREPELVYKLPPRRFEELVAELYIRRGFDATLTPSTGDGGVDVFVVRNDELGSSLSVVQCKRYAPNHKVGVGMVRELQGTIVGTGASAGVLLTTSFFTGGAKALEQKFEYQLSLQDYYALQKLLRLPRLGGAA